MARMRIDGEWHEIGDDDKAQLILAGMQEAHKAGQSVVVVTSTDERLGSRTILWTSGVPVIFETTFPLSGSAKIVRPVPPSED